MPISFQILQRQPEMIRKRPRPMRSRIKGGATEEAQGALKVINNWGNNWKKIVF